MKREAVKVTFLLLVNTFVQVLFWTTGPWWVAIPFSIISVGLVASLVYASITLAYARGQLDTAVEINRHGTEALCRAIIRQLVSNAPNN